MLGQANCYQKDSGFEPIWLVVLNVRQLDCVC